MGIGIGKKSIEEPGWFVDGLFSMPTGCGGLIGGAGDRKSALPGRRRSSIQAITIDVKRKIGHLYSFLKGWASPGGGLRIHVVEGSADRPGHG